jgi:NADP-dependent 3-hydroxy acid dehydrogenase YdfG
LVAPGNGSFGGSTVVAKAVPAGWIRRIVDARFAMRRKVTNMGRLDGKIAAVTGGASGIGEATVRRFVAVDEDVEAPELLRGNAGIRKYEKVDEASAVSWKEILDVNLMGYVFLPRRRFR